MQLKEFKAITKLRYGKLVCVVKYRANIIIQETDVDIVRIWRKPNTKLNLGRNSLVQFAIRVLSIAANSAGLERSWSKLGNIHTKLRNRLALEKARKTSVLVDDLRRRHTDASLSQKRRKRCFRKLSSNSGTSASASTTLNSESMGNDMDTDSDDENLDMDFRAVAQKCIDDVENDCDIEDVPQSPNPPPRVFFGTKEPIPLELLFKFPADHSATSELSFFKHSALRNLEKEMQLYEYFSSDLSSIEGE
jgi:hAT family C-terminal dimerisation region